MGSLCIIPAFEEEATIGQVVAGALKHCGTILVIDDNSQDQTAIVSRQAGATVIRHVLRLGTGAALSTGFRAALKTDSEIFLTMDGDGQHDPDQIPNLTDLILRDEADVVVGSRLLSPPAGMPLGKRIGNRILSATTSLAAGTQITDSQSGFRAYRREVLEYAIHQARDYRWASEILILAAKGNFRIREIPVAAVYLPQRVRGTSIKDGLKILYSTVMR